MKRFLLVFLAMALLGCGTAEAQMTSPNPNRGRRPPSPALMPAPSPMAVSGTAPSGSATQNGPGAIQLYLGVLTPFPGASLGAITICPTTGIIGPASAATASAAPMSGSLMSAPVSGGLTSSPASGGLMSSSSLSVGPQAPQPLVQPLPITTPFGISTVFNICNPTATMTDPASDPASLASTADSMQTSSLVGSPVTQLPSTVAAPDFSDATVPSGATAPGLSPLIPVAPPVSVTTCAGSTSSLAMGNTIGATTILGVPSPSGC
jgi:hypothetical protein